MMFVSRHVVRTGSPDGDQRELGRLQAQAASQGLATQVQPLAGGGFQVDVVRPHGAPAGGYGAPPPAYGAPPPAYGPPPHPGAAMTAHPHMGMQHGNCDACGRVAPTKLVTFRQNIGLVVMRLPKTVHGNLCRGCIGKYFWETTLISSFFGWWGVISFFYTAVTIPMNIVEFLGARSLPEQ